MKTLVLIVVKVSEVRDNRFIEKPVFSSSGLVFDRNQNRKKKLNRELNGAMKSLKFIFLYLYKNIVV